MGVVRDQGNALMAGREGDPLYRYRYRYESFFQQDLEGIHSEQTLLFFLRLFCLLSLQLRQFVSSRVICC